MQLNGAGLAGQAMLLLLASDFAAARDLDRGLAKPLGNILRRRHVVIAEELQYPGIAGECLPALIV